MNYARYIISKPPYVMRNIPKFHTAEKLQKRQVLRFDIRNPAPGSRLWDRKKDASEHDNQDCIIETLEQIQRKEKQATEKRTLKRTMGSEEERHAKKRRTQRN